MADYWVLEIRERWRRIKGDAGQAGLTSMAFKSRSLAQAGAPAELNQKPRVKKLYLERRVLRGKRVVIASRASPRYLEGKQEREDVG
jgi:hypothetical protein